MLQRGCAAVTYPVTYPVFLTPPFPGAVLTVPPSFLVLWQSS